MNDSSKMLLAPISALSRCLFYTNRKKIKQMNFSNRDLFANFIYEFVCIPLVAFPHLAHSRFLSILFHFALQHSPPLSLPLACIHFQITPVVP